jgi:hypothetical protein
MGDASAIRVAFIRHHLSRAIELVRTARTSSGETAQRALRGAWEIVREFRRYIESCSGLIPEHDRVAIRRMLRDVEVASGFKDRNPFM